jgi:catalase
MAASPAWVRLGAMAVDQDLHEQLVDAANGIYGSHDRTRALHAKGFFCEGSFVAGPEAAMLTRAAHMQGERIPALIRFSTGGGNPSGHDSTREARGMAIKLRLPDGRATDLLGVTTPLFIARTPEDFLELLVLRKPDPETGQPDMEKLGDYLQRHPEAMAGVQATVGTPPPASYAQLAYNSLHAFGFSTARAARPGSVTGSSPRPARRRSTTRRRSRATATTSARRWRNASGRGRPGSSSGS